MITVILVGVGTMLLCLLLQAGLLVRAGLYYQNHTSWVDSPSVLASLGVVAMVTLILVLGNLAQGAIWAALYIVLGEFDDFANAFYHSLVNFSTLGYGDIVMSPQWRLLGPLQAINGVLMIGVTTGAVSFAARDSLGRTQTQRNRTQVSHP